LEARLGEQAALPEAATAVAGPPTNSGLAEASESLAVVAHDRSSANGDDAEPPGWPDDAAESAFLAETRERGEPIKVEPAKRDEAEDSDPKSLPPLDELVKRIPANVREVLDDLFRARFVTVKRVPKKALK
jgi:hypothetical protein